MGCKENKTDRKKGCASTSGESAQEASAADTTKAPSSKQSIQTILNKTARKCGSVMEELSFVQAIEASPWLCLEPGTIITSMIEKLDDGTVVLSSKHRRDPCFNFEDVKNSIQIYSDTLLKKNLNPTEAFRKANSSSYYRGVLDAVECMGDWGLRLHNECKALEELMKKTSTDGSLRTTTSTSSKKRARPDEHEERQERDEDRSDVRKKVATASSSSSLSSKSTTTTKNEPAALAKPKKKVDVVSTSGNSDAAAPSSSSSSSLLFPAEGKAAAQQGAPPLPASDASATFELPSFSSAKKGVCAAASAALAPRVSTTEASGKSDASCAKPKKVIPVLPLGPTILSNAELQAMRAIESKKSRMISNSSQNAPQSPEFKAELSRKLNKIATNQETLRGTDVDDEDDQDDLVLQKNKRRDIKAAQRAQGNDDDSSDEEFVPPNSKKSKKEKSKQPNHAVPRNLLNMTPSGTVQFASSSSLPMPSAASVLTGAAVFVPPPPAQSQSPGAAPGAAIDAIKKSGTAVFGAAQLVDSLLEASKAALEDSTAGNAKNQRAHRNKKGSNHGVQEEGGDHDDDDCIMVLSSARTNKSDGHKRGGGGGVIDDGAMPIVSASSSSAADGDATPPVCATSAAGGDATPPLAVSGGQGMDIEASSESDSSESESSDCDDEDEQEEDEDDDDDDEKGIFQCNFFSGISV